MSINEVSFCRLNCGYLLGSIAGLFRLYCTAQHVDCRLLPQGRIFRIGKNLCPLGTVGINAVGVEAGDNPRADNAFTPAIGIPLGNLGCSVGPGDRGARTCLIKLSPYNFMDFFELREEKGSHLHMSDYFI